MLRLEREVEFVFRLPRPPLPLGYAATNNGSGRNRTSTLTPRAPVKLSLRFSLRSLRPPILSSPEQVAKHLFAGLLLGHLDRVGLLAGELDRHLQPLDALDQL